MVHMASQEALQHQVISNRQNVTMRQLYPRHNQDQYEASLEGQTLTSSTIISDSIQAKRWQIMPSYFDPEASEFKLLT